MKKKIRNLLIVLAACAVSAFAFIGSSCDTIEEQLKQATCEHVLVDGKVTKEATCTETGEKLLECTSCTYTEKKELPKLAHTELVMKAVSPTCTTSGKTEGKKCAVCNEILVRQNTVPATGHKAILDEAIEATCTAPGKTEGSHCEKCDTVFEAQETIPVKEHVLVNVGAYTATCEEKGFTGGTKCQNCDYATDGEVIPALGHSYDDGQITTEATCTNDGVKTFTCATCEDTYTETLAAVGHSYSNGTCSVCGEVEKAETITFTIDDTTYQAEEGMTWGEWIDSVYDNNDEYNQNGSCIHYEDTKYFIHMHEDMVYDSDIIVAGTVYQLIEVIGPIPS